MSFFNEVYQKFDCTFPNNLDNFKELVEKSNSINQLHKATNISKVYLKQLLAVYNLSIIPKCLYCKKTLPKAKKGTVKKFCNERCSYLYNTKEKQCKSCGKNFYAAKGIKYCSPECKKQAYTSIISKCKWCGKEYKSHKLSKFCSKKCKDRSYSYSLDKSLNTCEVCSTKFLGVYGCSKECRDKLSKERAKKLLIEIFGVDDIEKIKKGMNSYGKKNNQKS